MTKILLVDDDAEWAAAMQMGLQTKLQMKVDTAENGRVALDKMGDDHYAVVVLDMRMPVMSGEEFLERYQETDPHSRVIVLTGFPTVTGTAGALRGGPDAKAHEYLMKPVGIEELATRVREVAGGLEAGGFRIDLVNQTAWYGDQELFAGQGVPFLLLKHFLRYPNVPHTYEDLVKAVYGEELHGRAALNRLRSSMHRFRAELREVAGREVVTHNQGIGFVFRAQQFRREMS